MSDQETNNANGAPVIPEALSPKKSSHTCFQPYFMHMGVAVFSIGMSVLVNWVAFDYFQNRSQSQKLLCRLKQEIATQKILIEELDKSVSELKTQNKSGVQLSEQVQCINKKLIAIEQKFEQRPFSFITGSTSSSSSTSAVSSASPQEMRTTILDRAQQNKPFSDELQKYLSQNIDTPLKQIFIKLKPLSDHPVKTISALKTELETLRAQIIKAKLDGKPLEAPLPEGFFEKTWFSIKNKIRISKAIDVKPDQALLNTFEEAVKALNDENLDLCIQTIDKLDDSKKAVAQLWLRDAKERQQLDQIIVELKS